MPDNLNRKKPIDSKKINITQDWELDYWSRTLGVNKDKLKIIVKKVGPLLSDVKKEIGNK